MHTLHPVEVECAAKSARPTASDRGFTFIELLIAVVILGVLATVAIPRFQDNSEEAKLARLQSDLRVMRDAIERYHLEHNAIYPGYLKTDGSGQVLASAAQAARAFEDQLTLYTDRMGGVSKDRTPAFPYGPYLKRMVTKNPFNGSAEVVCDPANAELDRREAEIEAGWKYYPKSGVFHAGDEAHKTY